MMVGLVRVFCPVCGFDDVGFIRSVRVDVDASWGHRFTGGAGGYRCGLCTAEFVADMPGLSPPPSVDGFGGGAEV